MRRARAASRDELRRLLKGVVLIVNTDSEDAADARGTSDFLRAVSRARVWPSGGHLADGHPRHRREGERGTVTGPALSL